MSFTNAMDPLKRQRQHFFVHKNTVQYQLKKLAELTGFDPRNIRHAALWELVLLLYPNSELDHHA